VVYKSGNRGRGGMQCPNCYKDVVVDAVFCPYCGKELRVSAVRKNKRTSVFYRVLLDFILLVVYCGFFSVIFLILDFIDGTRKYIVDVPFGYYSPITWAPVAVIVIVIVGFNIASADIMRLYTKRHGRNTIAWVTATIIFTPILAGIFYFLTWPKEQKLK
jgi:hypothetical protein